MRQLAWIKKPFQLLDRTANVVFNYCTDHPVFASVTIYILVATTVFFNFYLHPDGLVWGDGYYYLSTAKSIANGDLWQDGIKGAFEKMNPLWPIGYPALIGYLSKLTELGVFWSSKIINFIALAGMIGILHKWFYPVGWIYSLCFFNAAVMEVISLTLSEPVFLFGLLSFIILLDRIRKRPSKVIHYWLLAGILAYLCLTRYVGGFAFITTCVFAVLYWPNLKPHWNKLLLALIGSGLIVGFYISGNYLVHGHPFGERSLDFRNPLKVLNSFFSSGIMLTNFPINLNFYDLKWIGLTFIFQVGAFIFFFFKRKCQIGYYPNIANYDLNIYKLFFFIYLIVLTTAISIGPGSLFDFRKLLPAFIVAFLGIMIHIYQNHRKYFPSLAKSILVVCCLSFFLNLPAKNIYRYSFIDKPLLSYSEKVNVLKSKYQDLSKGQGQGVVINGSRHLSYTRSNLRPIKMGAMYDGEKKLKVKYLKALVDENKQVLLNISPKHFQKATFEKHGFLLELKSNKGLLNLYEIKESTS